MGQVVLQDQPDGFQNAADAALVVEFLEFVQIDSESCNEKAMGERLCQVLKELGLEPITDEAGKTYNSNGSAPPG